MSKLKKRFSLNEYIENVVKRPKGAKGKYEIKKARRKYLRATK